MIFVIIQFNRIIPDYGNLLGLLQARSQRRSLLLNLLLFLSHRSKIVASESRRGLLGAEKRANLPVFGRIGTRPIHHRVTIPKIPRLSEGAFQLVRIQGYCADRLHLLDLLVYLIGRVTYLVQLLVGVATMYLPGVLLEDVRLLKQVSHFKDVVDWTAEFKI